MTQKDRVKRALLQHPGGVNETSFAAPHVIDGGKPIRRVAARVWDLRQDGWEIVTSQESNGTATYRIAVAGERIVPRGQAARVTNSDLDGDDADRHFREMDAQHEEAA